MSSAQRGQLYRALAETLSEPPEWMAAPGREWPLFQCATALKGVSEGVRRAAAEVGDIPAEPLPERRARYRRLFEGPGQSPIWLYESVHLNGKLAGPEMFAVGRLYEVAGLAIPGAELPDHASLELAFLAYLAHQQGVSSHRRNHWRTLERQFIVTHAGRWLPDVGRELMRTGDEVYGPVGRLLAGWLAAAVRPAPVRRAASRNRVPALFRAEPCTLCGFCVQVCPTRALAVRESTNETALLLSPAACVGCGKCVRVCESRALAMTESSGDDVSTSGWVPLRVSPRVHCPVCNRPTVSQAELDYVAGQIGGARWLTYCLPCRGHIELDVREEVMIR